MWGQIDGRTKIDIAREALAGVVGQLPPDTEMGLMAYGHREKGSCDDIELIVDPAAGTGQAIIDAANALQFKGKTPLTESVRRAAAALKSTEEKATVILITDGIETCEADPCALGAELEASGVDFTAHVVGFGLSAEEGKKVACLAENTGGKFVAADDLASLATALETTVIVAAEPEPAPEPPAPAALAENVDPVVLMTKGGAEPEQVLLQDAYFEFFPMVDGKPAEASAQTIYGASKGAVPAGPYRMRVTLHEAVAEADVTIGPDSELSQPTAVLDAGVLNLVLLSEEGGEPNSEALWEMRGPDDVYDAGYARALRVFPAGEYAFNAALGEVKANDAVVIEAGKVTDKTVVLGAGIPVFTAYYTEGTAIEGDQTFELFEAKQGLDGKRAHIRTDYGAGSAPELPPGDYVVLASVGPAMAEQAFSIKAGERKDVPVILNAGIVAITAPNANAIEIVGAKPALDGSRPFVYTHYGPEVQQTLNAGDYVAIVASGEAKAEFPFTVKAAERTEVQAKVAVGMAAISAPGATAIMVVGAKAALDGSRETFDTQYSETSEVMLPPGDYLVQVEAGYARAEQPFTVKPDERVEVKVAVAMGVVKVTAPGAKSLHIAAAKPDLNGNREGYGTDYRDSSDAKLAPGDYAVISEYDDGSTVETAFTVTDGAVTEVTVTKP
jgi:Ca-activated chloride channel family protein